MLYRQNEIITLSRQELYEQVWTTPTVALAQRYGISDVALAKICKKHQIPKPPLGYWTKVAVGKQVERQPLPAIADLQLQQIRIRKRSAGAQAEHRRPETKSALTVEQHEAAHIVVPPQLESPHPISERTLISLQSAAKNALGLVRPKAKPCWDIAVCRDNINRAVLIMDTLVKALDARGYPVSVREDNGAHDTCVMVRDEAVPIQLKELLNHKEKAVTPKQREDYLRWHRRPEVEYFPSGRLALCIVSDDIKGCRRIWTDGVRQQVEHCLNAFIGGLLTAAEAIKATRAERERWKREREEAERQHHEADRRRWEEENRIRDLDAKLASWEKSQQIRHFLSAVEEAMTQKHGQVEPSSPLAHWLSWGRRYADSLDPMI